MGYSSRGINKGNQRAVSSFALSVMYIHEEVCFHLKALDTICSYLKQVLAQTLIFVTSNEQLLIVTKTLWETALSEVT